MEAKKFSFEENFVAQCVFPCFIMYCAKKISSRTNFCPSYVIVCYINPLFKSMDLQITAIHLHFKKSWWKLQEDMCSFHLGFLKQELSGKN